MLDTGAHWTLFRTDLADALGLFDIASDETIHMRTANGEVTGVLVEDTHRNHRICRRILSGRMFCLRVSRVGG